MEFFLPRLKRNLFLIMVTSLAEILLLGCASLPKQEYDDAKIWKEKVDYYNLKKYAPKDYEFALRQYKEAMSAYQNDNAKSKQNFQDALVAFEKLYDKGMPAIIAERTDELQNPFDTNKRKELQNELVSMNQYNLAKKEFEAGKLAFTNKDYENAFSHLNTSREALILYSIFSSRNEILMNGRKKWNLLILSQRSK